MRNTVRAEALLSLFTSTDRAAAIAGDLTEVHGNRGSVPFWLDVVRVLPSLWRRAVMVAPLRVLSLVALGCMLLVGPAFVGIAAVALFPPMASPVSWIALSLIWSAGAMRTGAELISKSPSRGMAACTTLAVVGEALMIALVVRATPPELAKFQLILSYTTILLAPILLLLGGAIARRRLIVRTVQSLE